MPNHARNDEVAAGARDRLTILIADDHAGTRQALQLLLGRLNCNADVVNDGREALEAVMAREYDMVLMDVDMPRMDGLEATRRIRREKADACNPRIVGISAYTTEEDREICLAVGMDDFLPKPIEIQALIRTLDEMGQRRVALC